MMMKMFSFLKNRAICGFLLSIAIFSCTERIDIKTNDAPSQLVIEGFITTDAKKHAVRITRSAGYFNADSPSAVSDAIVTISDDAVNIFHLYEVHDQQGLYQTADEVRGEEGKTYTLDVQVDAQHYRASAYLAHINDIDSVRLRTSLFSEKLIEVLVYADLPEENHYSIFVSINDSILNSTIDKYRVMSNFISGMSCYIIRKRHENGRPGGRNDKDDDSIFLKSGDKVTLNINVISREYADFINAAQTELRGTIPIFGGPPANVPSNIESVNAQIPALGFFTAFPSRYADVTHEE
jgi:hypothetical protein